MKYIMLECTIGDKEQTIRKKVPIMFPSFMIHEDVAKAAAEILSTVHNFRDVKPVSAGTYIFSGNISCYDHSTTLKLEAHEDDSEIIDMYDYFGGVI